MDPMGNWRSIPLHLLDVMSILGAGLHELDAKRISQLLWSYDKNWCHKSPVKKIPKEKDYTPEY